MQLSWWPKSKKWCTQAAPQGIIGDNIVFQMICPLLHDMLKSGMARGTPAPPMLLLCIKFIVCLPQVVKVYPDGKMSKHIVNLNVGDSLECKGPISKLPYKPNMKKNVGMVRFWLSDSVQPLGMSVRTSLMAVCQNMDRTWCHT